MATLQRTNPRRPQKERRDRNKSVYDAHNNLSNLRDNVERSATSRGQTLAYMVESTQNKLANARGAIKELQHATDPWKENQSAVLALLSPLREVAQFVNAVADAHPCTKAIASVVIVVVEMELRRLKNDMQIAITFYEMSICILVLADLDRVYANGHAPPGFLASVEVHLEGIVTTIKKFAGFCEMYYGRSAFVKMCKSSTYKDKLASYATAFDKLKQDLHLDISAHASMKVAEIDSKIDTLAIDVEEIKSLLRVKSQSERFVANFIDGEGGLDAVLTDDRKILQIGGQVNATVDAKTFEMLREDVDRTVERHMNRNELLFQYACERLETSFRLSFDDALSRKLEEGAHQLIEDAEIRNVWQKMKASTSVKTRVFLNALQEHFLFEAVKYEAQHGDKSPNHWALHFLSKMIFYPAIGDVLDEDLSGFVSLNEVNNFLMSRPAVLKCNSIQWIAFWGFGPYKTNVELVREIKTMLGDIEKMTVRPEHERCLQYFKGVTQRLRMISVHPDIIDYLGDTETADSNYGAFEEVRQEWKRLELQRIERNLRLVDYTLPGAEAIVLVLGNRRLEHYIIFLVYALLKRQLRVIRIAQRELVSVREFVDMRMSWECLFRIFDERLNLLLKVWRQHRLDLSSHVETYAGGLFEEWYHFRSAIMEDTTSDEANVAEDTETLSYPYRRREQQRRISTFQSEIDQSPLINIRPSRSSPEPTNDPILNYDQPKSPEDESSLVIEEEPQWKRRADLEREDKAKLDQRLGKIEEKLDYLLKHLQLESGTNDHGSTLFHPARSEIIRRGSFDHSTSTISLQGITQLSTSPKHSRSGSPVRITHEDRMLPPDVQEAWQKPRSSPKKSQASHIGQATPESPSGQHGYASRVNTLPDSGIIPASLNRSRSAAGEDHVDAQQYQPAYDSPRGQMLPPPLPLRSTRPPGSGGGAPTPPAPITPPAYTPPAFHSSPLESSVSSGGQSNPNYSPVYTRADPWSRRNSVQSSPAAPSPALHSRTPSNTLPPMGPFFAQPNASDRNFGFPTPVLTGNLPNNGYAAPTSAYGSVPHSPQYGSPFQ